MRTVPLVVLVVLLAPVAGALWAGSQQEPDTPFDHEGWMLLARDTSPDESSRYVHFNTVVQFGNAWTANPNVGPVGSRVQPFDQVTASAFLGFWKDCNDDGYVGFGAGALREYRAELLADTTVCPQGGTHNDGEWVYELLWIGPDGEPRDATYGRIPRSVDDAGARVWGDWGAPREEHPVRGAYCPGPVRDRTVDVWRPFAPGTTASTGALVGALDCQTGHGAARALADAAPGLAFEDPEAPERSTSPLNQHLPVNLWGNPHAPEGHRTGLLEPGSGDPAFSLWDCSDPRGGDLRDPTAPPGGAGLLYDRRIVNPVDGSTVRRVSLTGPDGVIYPLPATSDAPLRDPTGSWHDGLDDAETGALAQCRERDGIGADWLAKSWYPERAHAESPVVRGRMSSDFVLYYNYNYNYNGGTGDVRAGGVHPRPMLGEDAPRDGGFGPAGVSLNAPGWQSTRVERPPQVFRRSDLAPAPTQHATFYARLGPAALALAPTLPSATTGVYGGEWCGGKTSGIHGGWDCDVTHWWNPGYDATTPGRPRTPERSGVAMGEEPGAAFHLRDVDCFDGTLVRGVPVRASLVDLAEKESC